MVKSQITDAGQTVGECEGSESATFTESSVPNPGQGARESEGGEMPGVAEYSDIEHGQRVWE